MKNREITHIVCMYICPLMKNINITDHADTWEISVNTISKSVLLLVKKKAYLHGHIDNTKAKISRFVILVLG